MNEYSPIYIHSDFKYRYVMLQSSAVEICEWVMSHMNEWCHIWMSHVTYEWVMSHMNEWCHICACVICHLGMRHVINGWVMSHLWISHVTHVKESRHTCERVMAQVNESCLQQPTCFYLLLPLQYVRTHMSNLWLSQVTCVNVSYHICGWVMPQMNESCHTCERVMTHMDESCHMWMSHVTYEWVMSHINESCHIWMRFVT